MSKSRNALLSVYHKDGIVEFAQELVALDFAIYASGGTAKHLTAAGITVIDVATLVGGEAILGHRVVTLSREVHAGLLARPIDVDIAELESLGIPRLDLVCVDLYPLEAEIARPGSTLESVIEQTDIGGPTMLRSAAKGQRIVICDPDDRQLVIRRLKVDKPMDGWMDDAFIRWLCAKAEFVVSKYCLASAAYLSNGVFSGFIGAQVETCRYGENAYQTPAALFSTLSADPLALDKFAVVYGAAPSYNNWCDIDRLLQTMTHIAAGYAINYFDNLPHIAIGVKHGNACGAAVGGDQLSVLSQMMDGDRQAIFGGLVMTNFEIAKDWAEVLAGKILDGIVAPGFAPEAIDMLRRKGDKCRFVVNPELAKLDADSLDKNSRFRNVRGGFLHQPNYTFVLDFHDTKNRKWFGAATPDKREDLLLAWAIGSTSNSNTITLVKNGMLLGNGVGQQSRVAAAKLAIERALSAGHEIKGAVAYSDSFFPFPDGPQVLIDAGVKAIITSSGSVRDQETIDLCWSKNVSLYMIPDQLGRGFYQH